MTRSWHVIVENFPAEKSTAPCRVSIPVARGKCRSLSFCAERPDGSIVRAQSRVLVEYQDGSPKWIQIDFEGNGNGSYRIKQAASQKKAKNRLSIEKNPDGFCVRTRRLMVKISKREAFPVCLIEFDGHLILQENTPWEFFAKAENTCFQFRTDTDSFNIEAQGENRFQISWRGTLVNPKTGEKLFDVKNRIEFLAGIEGFSLSFQVFHCLPEKPFLNIDSLSCAFSLPGFDRIILCQESYSNLSYRRFVETQKDIEVFLDTVEFYPYVKDPCILGDTYRYPVFLRNLNQTTKSAVCLKNRLFYTCINMRDFIHHRPKKIRISGGRICYEIWPHFAGTLNIQQGSSYRVLFDIVFSDDAGSVKGFLENPDAVRVEPVYCCIEKKDSVDAGETFHYRRLFSEKDSGLFSWILSSATRRFSTVSAMFHHGDTYDEGYTAYHFSHNRFPQEMKPAGILYNTEGGIYKISDGIEPVWANNEYDAIYCLALEYLRSRNFSVFRRLESAARHQIEIDFVHYSDSWQQHRSTPQHSYGHIRTMSSLPSHQWTQGLYHYYVLTGDDDVCEVIRAICDFNMTYFDRIPFKFNNFFNREYGWAILALVYGYEATGCVLYLEKAASMIKELAENTSSEEARNAFGKGFYQNTVLLGLMAYHQATNHSWAKRFFLRWVDHGMKNFSDRSYGPRITELFIEPLTYAYYLTGNKKYLIRSLWHFELFFRGWNDLGWFSDSKNLSTKRYARIYRALVHFVSACKHAGLMNELEKLTAKN